MKPFFVALLSLMLVASVKGQDVSNRHPTVDSMEPDFLDFWFSSVQIDHANLVMKRSLNNIFYSYMFQKGTDTPVASPPGSVHQLPLGMPGLFFCHIAGIKFIPFPDRSGRNLFLLEETNRIGDTHVGLLCLTAKGTKPRSAEVLPVWVDTREGLASVEAQVKAGTYTYPEK